MPKSLNNLAVLDKAVPIELTLELLSFAAGENTEGADAELKANEMRIMQNWEPTALGTIIRASGFNEVGDGGATYTSKLDFLIQHFEGTSTAIYGIIEGDLVILSGSSLAQEDNNIFTSGTLCHGVSAGGALWVTNRTDNLKRKTIGNAMAAATNPPTNPCDRIYEHKQRLVAEGAATTTRRIYGSRVGSANWNAADGFSLAGDAWNIDMPDDTQGCVPGFPSADEILVFTRFGAYAIYGMPNVAWRPLRNVPGCSAPYSIAKSEVGVFYVSRYPSEGVFLWNGVEAVDLTANHEFIDKIDFNNRIFGIFRNGVYHLFYRDTDGTATYPDTWMQYDTQFGGWRERPVNLSLADNFGYPALLTRSNNQLYVGSSVKDKIYELETGTDDESLDTEATLTTKDFTSADFRMPTGGKFPIDNVRLKLVSGILKYYLPTGAITLNVGVEKGRRSISKIFQQALAGDIINSTFIVNTSLVVTSPPQRMDWFSFKNNAVGRSFNFQLGNEGTSTRPEIHQLIIKAIAYDEL